MIAARTRRLSPLAHYVDDLGALCAVEPPHGRWVASVRVPVNCPKCLYLIGRTRLAFCEAPARLDRSKLHIRVVGMEGFQRTSRELRGARTLCKAMAAFDRDLVDAARLHDPGVCVVCRNALLSSQPLL